MVQQLVDVGLGADVDAHGGFLQHEQVSAPAQPACEQDFLLIATAERGDDSRWITDANRELVNDLSSPIPFAARSLSGPHTTPYGAGVEKNVLGHAQAQRQAFRLTVAGYEPNARRHRIRYPAVEPERPPSERHGPTSARIDS